MQKQERGIIFAAHGQDFVNEAINALKQIRKFNDRVEVTLFTDELSYRGLGMFDNVKLIKGVKGYQFKIRAMELAPYDQNVFFDTDVFITCRLGELFNTLIYYDIVGAVEVGYMRYADAPKEMMALNEINTGVLAFRKNAVFFKKWFHIYDQHLNIHLHDQYSFLMTLATSRDTRFGLISNRYNFRFTQPQTASGLIKIFHGRTTFIKRVVKRVNSRTENRSWIPSKKQCIPTKGIGLQALLLRLKLVSWKCLTFAGIFKSIKRRK